MKKLSVVLAASLIAGASYAQDAGTKVSGQIFTKFTNSLSDSASGNKVKGFDVDRARVNVDSSINENWKAHIAVEAAQANNTNTSTFFIKKAYLQGSGIFAENDFFRTGITSNMYKDYVYKVVSTRWIEKIGGDYKDLNGEHTGLRYGAKMGDFTAAVEIHNGEQDNKKSGTTDEAIGTAIYASYKMMDSLSFHLFLNSNAEAKEVANSKETTTSLAVGYNHSMFDLLFETTKFDNDGTATPMNTRLTLDYRFTDMVNAYLSVNSFKDDDGNDATASTVKTKVVVGPSFNLAKGLKTGVFYSLSTPEDSNAEKIKSISWNWEAKF